MKKDLALQQSQLNKLARYLKLSTLPHQAGHLAKQAKLSQLPYEDYLIQLLELEVEDKQTRATKRRIHAAKFPFCKTLDEFDFALANPLPQSLLLELMQSRYIQQAQPIIFIGEPGTGKTHLAIALGYAAAKTGCNVKFVTLAQLANQLIEAKDGRTLSSIINRFSKVDLLIIDEFGYVPLSQVDAELIFQILSHRQEKSLLLLRLICRLVNGSRSLLIQDYVKRLLIELLIKRISSKQEKILLA
jgi:DNA replication protein DnaC